MTAADVVAQVRMCPMVGGGAGVLGEGGTEAKPRAEKQLAFDGEAALSRPIRVKIKRLAASDGLALPTRMTEHAAGFDL